MDREIDIVESVKMRRYFKMALAKLIPEKERKEMQEQCRYLSINPDDKETHSFISKKTMRFEMRSDSSLKMIKDTTALE